MTCSGVQSRRCAELLQQCREKLALDLHTATDRPQDLDQQEVRAARLTQVGMARVMAKVLGGKLERVEGGPS
jgi:hypothetical protein